MTEGMSMRCALCDQLDGFLFDLNLMCDHLLDAHGIVVADGADVTPGDIVVLT